MSVNVGKTGSEIKNTAKEVVDEIKEIAKPATKEGIATNMVGYVLSIPLSYAYDFLYNLLAKKFITNQIASDVLKVVIPAGVGAVFQFGKLPLGNVIAGTGYGIALMSVIKIIITRVKGRKTTTDTAELAKEGVRIHRLWGVE
ncbi:hypothetical protein LCGC14_1264740 [marine sediment metagenome]|uniref:Uncharacterized protein n=1 Tax=marine sediment metagenome TaxID=412755 RepID=A0A0F9NGM8_9ZZZZ